MSAEKILFRCSSLGHLMTEPREKSPKDKLKDAIAAKAKAEQDYADMENKKTKTAQKKLESIEKFTKQIEELVKIKDQPFLSGSAITHLIDCFVSFQYGRREEITNKFLDKGNEREEDSITLLSRVTKIVFFKNEVHLTNDFTSGTPDLFLGEKTIARATETFDTKTSWSAHTFFRAKNKELDEMYYWQGQGYMWLTGAKKHTVAYCLVNGTANAILDEKRKLAYRLGIIDTTAAKQNQEYVDKCKQIEINHIFDLAGFQKEYPWFEFDNDVENWKWDIPMAERVHMISFDRSEEQIAALQERITVCRQWMTENLFKTTPEPAAAVPA